MSYSLLPYLLDIDKLKAVFGSEDGELLPAIEAKSEDEFRRNGEWFKDEIADGAPTLKSALSQIVSGRITGPGWAAFQYGYALELLCKHYGRLLDNDLFEDTRGDWIERVGLVVPLIESGPPIPIPRASDFPSMGHFTLARAREELNKLRDTDLSEAEEIVVQGREQYVSWLEQAVETKKGIVAFYY